MMAKYKIAEGISEAQAKAKLAEFRLKIDAKTSYQGDVGLTKAEDAWSKLGAPSSKDWSPRPESYSGKPYAPFSKWAPPLVKPKFYEAELIHKVERAWLHVLEELGPQMVDYCRRMMKTGNYKAWLSKRPYIYGAEGVFYRKKEAKSPESGIMTAYKYGMKGKRRVVTGVDSYTMRVGRLNVEGSMKFSSPTEKKRRMGFLRQQIAERKELLRESYMTIGTAEAYKWNKKGTSYGEYKIRRKSALGDMYIKKEKRLQWSGYGLIHMSAAPGAFPAPDTERLKRSIRYEIVEKPGPQMKYTIKLGGYTGYARAVELGTRNVAARPYILPTILAFRKRFAVALKNAMSLEKVDSASRAGKVNAPSLGTSGSTAPVGVSRAKSASPVAFQKSLSLDELNTAWMKLYKTLNRK